MDLSKLCKRHAFRSVFQAQRRTFARLLNGKQRTGLIAMKIGMMGLWDDWGRQRVVTVLHVDQCQVLQAKTKEKDGSLALQLGAGVRKTKRVNKPMLGHFARARTPPKAKIKEFAVTEDCMIPEGTHLNAGHFVPGQLVDITGTSIGKGFQGVMKRHNFKGQSASHGNSKSHRSAGSTGQCQDPGRTFKGKKMAGRMGGKQVNVLNLPVYKVDILRNLVYVEGHVPGNKGGFVFIRDSFFKKQPTGIELPYPTYIFNGEENEYEFYAPSPETDPIKYDTSDSL